MTKRLRKRIDGFRDLAVELETGLCARPAVSPESGGEGELAKCRYLEDWLRGAGFTGLERYDAPDPRAAGGVRPNLVVTLPGGGAGQGLPRLWIMSHLDVVPPGERSLWTGDPWTARVDGNRIIGRGVEDNQQGVVASALAALAFMREGFHPARPTTLLFVADEEMGSEYGVGWLMKAHGDLFRPGDMALVPDSGDARGESVEVAEKNIAWARFTVRGTQAHGSRPDHGVNAHLAGAALILRLHEDLRKRFDGRDPLFEPAGSTFEPTRKDANVPNVNTIPGEDVFYFDMRILPRYPVDDVLGEVDRVQAAVEAAYGVRVERALVQRMESPATAADAPVVGLLARAAREVYGVTIRPVGIGGGTVAAYLRKAGMDAVVWSRIAGNAHAPDEYALLDNILGDAAVMALMMAEGG